MKNPNFNLISIYHITAVNITILERVSFFLPLFIIFITHTSANGAAGQLDVKTRRTFRTLGGEQLTAEHHFNRLQSEGGRRNDKVTLCEMQLKQLSCVSPPLTSLASS